MGKPKPEDKAREKARRGGADGAGEKETPRRPEYIRLYLALRDRITGGVYACGDRLPSKRVTAENTGTSVITVEHALQLLIDEGYIESRERSGYYVIYREKDLFPVGTREELKPAAAVQPSEETFSFAAFARTMRRVLTKYGDAILVKSPNFGCMELRSELAAYLARSRGIMVSPEQIVIGSGAEYMYSMIAQMLGRSVIYGIEDPSYAQIEKVYIANGVTCDPLKMGTAGILTSELQRTNAGVLHVTPYNSYPTGVTAGASKRREYIEWAGKRSAMIIEDDVDSEFTMSTKAEDTLFSLEPERSVIYLNTFSKTIAPSMRAGYMILPSHLTALLKSRIAFYSCTVPVFEQYVLAEFIGSGDFERHINRVRRQRRKRSRS